MEDTQIKGLWSISPQLWRAAKVKQPVPGKSWYEAGPGRSLHEAVKWILDYIRDTNVLEVPDAQDICWGELQVGVKIAGEKYAAGANAGRTETLSKPFGIRHGPTGFSLLGLVFPHCALIYLFWKRMYIPCHCMLGVCYLVFEFIRDAVKRLPWISKRLGTWKF